MSALIVLLELNRLVLAVALLLLLLPGGWIIWLVAQHLRLCRHGTAREAALLERDLPPDQDLPDVLVQIPTYNEGLLLHRVGAAIGALDWPRDRLHVQFLDDSGDADRAVARVAVAALCAQGIDAVLLSRSARTGFKAGALAAGLARSPHDYVAILDVDFVPRPDFLRQCLRPLLADPGLAFVQTRWSYLNAGENALTRAQQTLHDAHFAIEQTAKSWSGHLVTFNGSGGVWRRRAIDGAGGWTSDTLAEDVDMSFKAQIGGWRAMILAGIDVPSELPATLRTWQAQQTRWSRALGQVARKHLPMLWRSRLGFGRKLAATLNLVSGSFGPVLLVALLSGAIELVGGGPSRALVLLALLVAVIDIGATLTGIVLGQRHLHRTAIGIALPQAIGALAMLLYLHLWSAASVLAAWRGRTADFVRTPKQGAAAEPGDLSPSAVSRK